MLSSVFIRRIIYKFLNVYPFDHTAFAVSGKVGIPWTGLTCRYSNWPSYVGPQSLCNRSFGGVFVLLRCFLDFSGVVGAFVIRLRQISSFFYNERFSFLNVGLQSVNHTSLRDKLSMLFAYTLHNSRHGHTQSFVLKSSDENVRLLVRWVYVTQCWKSNKMSHICILSLLPDGRIIAYTGGCLYIFFNLWVFLSPYMFVT